MVCNVCAGWLSGDADTTTCICCTLLLLAIRPIEAAILAPLLLFPAAPEDEVDIEAEAEVEVAGADVDGSVIDGLVDIIELALLLLVAARCCFCCGCNLLQSRAIAAAGMYNVSTWWCLLMLLVLLL